MTEDLMTTEDLANIRDLLQRAFNDLQPHARKAHPEPQPGQIVTRDMCPCGMTTGVGATPQCNTLRDLHNTIHALESIIRKRSGK